MQSDPGIGWQRTTEHLREQIRKLADFILPGSQGEVLFQLFISGPTWDGDIISKSDRDALFDRGLADRVDGWSFLTRRGLELCLLLAADSEKNKREQIAREERAS